MKTIQNTFDEMIASFPPHMRMEADLSFAIADRLDSLIKSRGLSKKDFAAAIGSRPSEVTKWLSGQQNFTIRTIAKISAFFNEPLIMAVE